MYLPILFFTFWRQIYIICNSPSSIDHTTDQSRLPVAGWVLGGMLGDSPSSVVAGGSTVTGQYPVVGQCDEGLWSSVELGFGLILWKLGELVVKLLPSDLNPRLTFHSIQWKTGMCPLVMALPVGLLFIFRLVQSVRSQLYLRHERQLSETLAAWIKEKCQLTDKLRVTEKERAETESVLENVRLAKESLRISGLTNTYRKVRRTNSMLMEKLTSLVKELKEKSKRTKQKEEREEMLKVLESLKEVTRLMIW